MQGFKYFLALRCIKHVLNYLSEVINFFNNLTKQHAVL